MKKIVVMIVNIVAVVVAVCVILFIVLFLVGVKPYVVLSGSMEPSIKTGSICFVDERASYEKVHTGDMIAFQLKTGNMVTHRVISVTEMGLETKGDANDFSDGITTTKTNFKGKTIFSVPYLGYFSTYLRTMQGKAILFSIMATGIFVEILEGSYRRKRRICKEYEKTV